MGSHRRRKPKRSPLSALKELANLHDREKEATTFLEELDMKRVQQVQHEQEVAVDTPPEGNTETPTKQRKPRRPSEDSPLLRRLGKALLHKREFLGLSTLSFAKVLGMDASVYRKLESGSKKLTTYQFFRLMKIFDIKQDCIFEEINTSQEQQILKQVIVDNDKEIDDDMQELRRQMQALEERKAVSQRLAASNRNSANQME